MTTREDLFLVLEETLDRRIHGLRARISRITMEEFGAVSIANSRAHAIRTADECTLVSINIAEEIRDILYYVFEENASEKSSILDKNAEIIAHQILEIYKNSTILKDPNHISEYDRHQIPDAEFLKKILIKNVNHAARELRLGISKGMRTKSTGDTYYVSNSSGVVMGNRGSTIQVGGNELIQTVGWNPTDLLALVKEFHSEIIDNQKLTKARKDQLKDIILDLEYEIESSTNEKSKIFKIIQYLKEKVDVVATETGISILNQYMTKILDLLPS